MNATKKEPLISVVIPIYNAEQFIEKALKSVLKTNYPNFEIVIVDDMSTDKGVKLIKKLYSKNKKIRIYENKTKLNAAGSRNRGSKLAKGEYIALLDHDIEVDRNWLKEAIKVFKKYKNVGVVQTKVLDLLRRDTIQLAGIKINSYLGWVIPLGFGKPTDKYYNEEIKTFADATGLIYKKSVWKDVGGFDEDLAINTDDWDFNWRCWLYKHEQMLAPKAITYHWSKTQKTRDKWQKRLPWEFHFAKVPWIFIKNYELPNMFRYLSVYLLVNLFRGLFNLVFRFNPSPLIAFFWANYWVITNNKTLRKKRKQVQKRRKIDDKYLLDNLMDKGLVIGYFIKNWLPILKLGKKMSTTTDQVFMCLICQENVGIKQEINVDGYTYKVCNKCKGATLVAGKKAIKNLDKIYNDKYFDWLKPKGIKSFMYKLYLHKRFSVWVSSYSNKIKGKDLLDVGAGTPEFVSKMLDLGWKPQALELSKKQAKKISKIIGKKNVYATKFENIKLHKKYDVITMWHLLEHLKNPKKAVTIANSILKKSGLLFIEVPNLNSYTFNMFKKHYSFCFLPDHLFYFSAESLDQLLEKYGFKVIEINYPLKYNLAFAMSALEYLKEEKKIDYNKTLDIIYYLLWPISIMLNATMSIFGKSELVRVVAQKQ